MLIQEIQIVGIAFNLIIVRASRLREHPDGTALGGHQAGPGTMSFRAAVNPSATFSSSTPEMTRYSCSRSSVESNIREVA